MDKFNEGYVPASASALDTEDEAGLYGISRIDDSDHRALAWRASLGRRNRKLVKNFPDKKYGGKQHSLQFAKNYRDWLLSQYPPLSRAEFASLPRSNNTSGVTGVYYVTCRYRLKTGQERRIFYWETILPTSPGRHINKRFSVSTFGYDGAFELACQVRRRGPMDCSHLPELPRRTPLPGADTPPPHHWFFCPQLTIRPLILLDRQRWQSETMLKMRVHDTDVIKAACTRGLGSLSQLKYATLKRNGDISIIETDEKKANHRLLKNRCTNSEYVFSAKGGHLLKEIKMKFRLDGNHGLCIGY